MTFQKIYNGLKNTGYAALLALTGCGAPNFQNGPVDVPFKTKKVRAAVVEPEGMTESGAYEVTLKAAGKTYHARTTKQKGLAKRLFGRSLEDIDAEINPGNIVDAEITVDGEEGFSTLVAITNAR